MSGGGQAGQAGRAGAGGGQTLGPAPTDPGYAGLASCTGAAVVPTPSNQKVTVLASCPHVQFFSAQQRGKELIAGLQDDGNAAPTHGLARVPLSGGQPELITHDPTPGVTLRQVIADETRIFYVVSSTPAGGGALVQLRAVTAPGQTPVIVREYVEPPVAGGLVNSFVAMTQDKSEVFLAFLVTDFPERGGKVVAFNKTTLAEREVGVGLDEPVDIRVDDDHVYGVSFGIGVKRAPKAGGAFEVFVPAVNRLGGLALGQGTVSFVDLGSYPQEQDGRILVAPKTGGASTVLAEGVIHADKTPSLDGDSVLLCAGAMPATGDPGNQKRMTRFAKGQPPVQLISSLSFPFCSPISFATDEAYFMEAGLVRIDR